MEPWDRWPFQPVRSQDEWKVGGVFPRKVGVKTLNNTEGNLVMATGLVSASEVFGWSWELAWAGRWRRRLLGGRPVSVRGAGGGFFACHGFGGEAGARSSRSGRGAMTSPRAGPRRSGGGEASQRATSCVEAVPKRLPGRHFTGVLGAYFVPLPFFLPLSLTAEGLFPA